MSASEPPEPEPQQPAAAIGGGAYLRLIGLGALIGIPAALVAVGFLAFVHQLEEWMWHDLPDALGYDSVPWFLVIGLPLVGAAIVWAARTLLPGDGGHDPLGGLNATPTPPRFGLGVALAALGTLPFGIVLGPEAPLIALGSVVGLSLTAWARLGQEERVVVATGGSFAAIAALFGGPLVAGVLLIEAGISKGRALIAALVPGLVAAAIGYTIFVGVGDWGGIDAQRLSIPGLPEYHGTKVRDLVLAVVIGLVAAIVIALVRTLATAIERRGPRRLGVGGLLFAGALAIGLLTQVAVWLGAESGQVLFSGQSTVATITAEGSVGIVLLLIAAKGLAYAISLSAGFRGGPIFPAIFLGVALATLAVIWVGMSPTVAVAIGAAAGMAAQSRLLFAPLVLATLLTGIDGLDAGPAAVLAASAAWVATTALDRREAARAQARLGALQGATAGTPAP